MGNVAFTALAQLTSPNSLTKGGLSSDLVSNKDLVSTFLQWGEGEPSNSGDMVEPGVPGDSSS